VIAVDPVVIRVPTCWVTSLRSVDAAVLTGRHEAGGAVPGVRRGDAVDAGEGVGARVHFVDSASTVPLASAVSGGAVRIHSDVVMWRREPG